MEVPIKSLLSSCTSTSEAAARVRSLRAAVSTLHKEGWTLETPVRNGVLRLRTPRDPQTAEQIRRRGEWFTNAVAFGVMREIRTVPWTDAATPRGMQVH